MKGKTSYIIHSKCIIYSKVHSKSYLYIKGTQGKGRIKLGHENELRNLEDVLVWTALKADLIVLSIFSFMVGLWQVCWTMLQCFYNFLFVTHVMFLSLYYKHKFIGLRLEFNSIWIKFFCGVNFLFELLCFLWGYFDFELAKKFSHVHYQPWPTIVISNCL